MQVQTLKLCCAPGCDDLAPAGEAMCLEHLAERAQRTAARRAKAKRPDVARAGAAFYATARWQRQRLQHLKRFPLCRDCGELGVVVAASEVDHITPHRGDAKLMWDRSNWQSLCRSCHSRKTAREVWHGVI